MDFIIPQEVAQAIANYLTTKPLPYGETHPLLVELSKLKPLTDPKKETK